MPRGGYRPGAGRPKGAKNKKKSLKKPKNDENSQKIKEILKYGPLAKAKIYQGFIERVSKGDDLSTSEANLMARLERELSSEIEEPANNHNQLDNYKNNAKQLKLTPAEFLLNVMNDENTPMDTRLRAAQLVAPFIHPRLAEQRGKKDDKKDRARNAGKGRFAPSAPPTLKAVK